MQMRGTMMVWRLSDDNLALLVLCLDLPGDNARDCSRDAGAVRVSQRHGNRQITVFTDPTPLRAGPVDVSILVQTPLRAGQSWMT